MFDLGWIELIFLAALALVVVGPRDLPVLAHGLGRLWARGRRLYRDSLAQLHKLEQEMQLASAPDERLKPSYYDLLPEHVRQALEVSEPTRDAAYNQRVQAEYQQAMATLQACAETPAQTSPQTSPQTPTPGEYPDLNTSPTEQATAGVGAPSAPVSQAN